MCVCVCLFKKLFLAEANHFVRASLQSLSTLQELNSNPRSCIYIYMHVGVVAFKIYLEYIYTDASSSSTNQLTKNLQLEFKIHTYIAKEKCRNRRIEVKSTAIN